VGLTKKEKKVGVDTGGGGCGCVVLGIVWVGFGGGVGLFVVGWGLVGLRGLGVLCCGWFGGVVVFFCSLGVLGWGWGLCFGVGFLVVFFWGWWWWVWWGCFWCRWVVVAVSVLLVVGGCCGVRVGSGCWGEGRFFCCGSVCVFVVSAFFFFTFFYIFCGEK